MLKISEIMTTNVLTAETDTPVVEVARDLSASKISGVPVLDRGKVVGVLSKTDIVGHEGGLSGLAAADLMTPLVHFLHSGMPAIQAVRMMLTEGIHRVIVTREHGHLAGIVTTTDVVRALERGLVFGPSTAGLALSKPKSVIS